MYSFYWDGGERPKHVLLITVGKRSCGKVMFSQACVKNFVHGGCMPQCMLGYTHSPPTRADTPRQTHQWVDTPQADNSPSPEQTATVVNGKRPTGMHSCLLAIFMRVGCKNNIIPIDHA